MPHATQNSNGLVSEGALSSLLDPDQWLNLQAYSQAYYILPQGGFSSISLQASTTAGLALVETIASGTAVLSGTTNNTAAKALGVTTAVAEYTVPGTGAALTGAGLTIGILSDSFNLTGGEAAAIAAGDLPAAALINILKEGSSGKDEGMAMAEIIHSIAPGATIDFYTATNSETDFAAGITALAKAGATIIVDDVIYTGEPFFQNTGVITQAVESVIASGVSYFTAAGNSANNFYEAGFTPMTVSLDTIGTVVANRVSNIGGTASPYEQITLQANATLNFTLEWTQSFNNNRFTGAATDIGVAIYTTSGTLVANYTTNDIGGDPVLSVDTTLANTAGTYEMVFYESAGTVNPGTFEIIFFQGTSGTIDGYGAGVGSGTSIGHQIAPGVNAVAAVDYTNTPAYGVGTPVVESFSSVGPGTTYLSSTGSLLATPITDNAPTFAATDGSPTTIFNPFDGTSAAAPAAAAVGALVLQTDSRISNAQLTYVLEQSAIATASTTNGGAGLIQANIAVGEAVIAATTPIWQGGTNRLWSTAANWTDNAAPTSTSDVVIGNGLGTISASYSVTLDPTSVVVAVLGIDGEVSTLDPTLSIAGGHSLSVTGALTIGTGLISDSGWLSIGGALQFGTVTATGTTTVGSGTGSADTIDITGGTLSIAGAQSVAVSFAGGGAVFLTAAGTPILTTGFTGGIENFALGDTLELSGLAYVGTLGITDTAGEATIYNGSTSNVVAQLALSGSFGTLGLAKDATTGGTVIVACFARGTGIATPAGEVAVEELRAGCEVTTLFAGRASVVWIGHRTIAAPSDDQQPVRVRADAFGDGCPRRDLLLSPEHAVFTGGVLIPVAALVDGCAITREDVGAVSYYHVLLAHHDVLLAEGLACESYLENQDPLRFDNAGSAPFGLQDLTPCAPIRSQGVAVEQARRLLGRRAMAGMAMAAE